MAAHHQQVASAISATSVNRRSLDVQHSLHAGGGHSPLSTAKAFDDFGQNTLRPRSRPSSPAPQLRVVGYDDEDARIDGNQRRNGHAHGSSSSGLGLSSNGLGLDLEGKGSNGNKHTVHAPRARAPLRHPLASTLSSGSSTPNLTPPPNGLGLLHDSLASDERSPLLTVEVERPSTPGIQQREYLSIPHDYEQDFDIPTFVSTERGGFIRPPTLKSRIKLFYTQLVANLISAGFLILIVVWALASRSLGYILARLHGQVQVRHPRPWDEPEKWKNEKLVRDVKYYARSCGYDIVDQEVITQDGYKLRVHKVVVPSQQGRFHSDGRGGFPVLIQHGLFQSSGSFVTSEERSLAFWLAEHGGYQVYLGNNRGVFDMGHTSLSRSDPRFWDYNIRELALYDLPAMVDHIRQETGYDKIAYIGHSQGNATMFVSLARGMVPDLGKKLSCFIALAPAVYSGPLTTGFPFTAIKHMDWKQWKRIFGVLDFIPLMRWSYDYTPSYPFALLGYQMFAFLFQWTDKNWLKRRKPKMFRFTPSPVPSAGIFWWTGLNGFSTRGCVLNPDVGKWYDKRFPPLALYHGGKDYLVLCDKLIDRINTQEHDVNLIRVHKLDEGEHCDNFWDVDAPENSFQAMLEDIEKTRPRYPEEEAALN